MTESKADLRKKDEEKGKKIPSGSAMEFDGSHDSSLGGHSVG